MNLTAEKIEKITQQPEEFAALANLVYVKDHQLSIQRHKHGRGFYYTNKEKRKITDKPSLERIKKLVIPPAWKDVRITHLENGHLQVVGRIPKTEKFTSTMNYGQDLKIRLNFLKWLRLVRNYPKLENKSIKTWNWKGCLNKKFWL